MTGDDLILFEEISEDLQRSLQGLAGILNDPAIRSALNSINDAADKDFEVKYFKSNYNKLIKIIQRVNPDCAILFVTNNDSYTKEKAKRKKVIYKVNPNGRIVEEAFMELGKQHNAAVWDQFDIMGGLGSMQDWENAELAQKDKVHFTSSGYRLIGDLLYNALISRYLDHVKANAKRQ